jgi:hypothetical protein
VIGIREPVLRALQNVSKGRLGRSTDRGQVGPVLIRQRTAPSSLPVSNSGPKAIMTSAFETMRDKLGWANLQHERFRRAPVHAQRVAESAQSLQAGNKDITLETLIEPKLLIAAGQLRQMFLDIGGDFAHRHRAVTIGIDLIRVG